MPIFIETGSYFTANEAAEFLGRRPAHVGRLVAQGHLKGFKVGKLSYLIPAAEVLARKQNPPTAGRPKSKNER